MAGLGGESAYGAAPRLARPLHRRCAAGFLTAVLYAGLVAVFLRGTMIHAVHAPQPDTQVRLDDDKPKPPPVTPILVQQVKPVAVNAAPPQFIIAPDPILQTPPAPAAMASSSVLQASAPVTGAEPGIDIAAIGRAYIIKVQNRLKEKMIYPVFARRMGEEGNAVVNIMIASDGTVLSESLTKSSGFSDLDEEALAMVIRASPLPPIPAALHLEKLERKMPITFQIDTASGAFAFRR